MTATLSSSSESEDFPSDNHTLICLFSLSLVVFLVWLLKSWSGQLSDLLL